MKKKQTKERMKKPRFFKLLICFAFILLLCVFFSQSKYAMKFKSINTVEASKFYIKSNELGIQEKENYYYDWDGKGKYQIEISIANYEDELRFSSFDINYDIKAEIISPQNGKKIELKYYINNEEKSENVLEGNKKSKDKIKIEIDAGKQILDENLEVMVCANIKSPYSQKIVGKFNIVIGKNKNLDTKLISEGDVENLIINTQEFSGDISINYDEKLLKLYKDSLFIENAEITNGIIKLKIEKNTNYSIKFIKLNSKNTITLGNEIKITT